MGTLHKPKKSAAGRDRVLRNLQRGRGLRNRRTINNGAGAERPRGREEENMTNREKLLQLINSMSDNELASTMSSGLDCDACPLAESCDGSGVPCYLKVERWLKGQEVKA